MDVTLGSWFGRILYGLDDFSSGLEDPFRLVPSAQLRGMGSGWGAATQEVKNEVMLRILDYSASLAPEDQAVLLGIARLESGFNPDAKSSSSSASGVFQIISRTANNLGLSGGEVFDADKNIEAAVVLYRQILKELEADYPDARGDQRAIIIYGLYHDGPSNTGDGQGIARRDLVPYLAGYRNTVALWRLKMSLGIGGSE